MTRSQTPARRGEDLPDWAANDTQEWKSARQGWVIVLLNGTPIWQQSLVYIDWGSGIGGYVPHFDPKFNDDSPGGTPELVGWTASRWAIGPRRLINSLSHTANDIAGLDPTRRLVTQPDSLPSTVRRLPVPGGFLRVLPGATGLRIFGANRILLRD